MRDIGQGHGGGERDVAHPAFKVSLDICTYTQVNIGSSKISESNDSSASSALGSPYSDPPRDDSLSLELSPPFIALFNIILYGDGSFSGPFVLTISAPSSIVPCGSWLSSVRSSSSS